MNSIEQFNPILFCDQVLECNQKDMPKVLNDKIGYQYGRQIEQKDVRPQFALMCMPFGEPKLHNFGSNFIEEYVTYAVIVESRDSASDAYRGVQKSLEIAHFIRLMTIDDSSQLRTFVDSLSAQITDITGVGMLEGEAVNLFKNAVGFQFTILQRMEWIGDLPPITTIIKSLYRMDTEEYIEGETIEEPEEEPEEPEEGDEE